MKVVLATGIYPPDIGGPATYVQALAEELAERTIEVVVVAYGTEHEQGSSWSVISVSKKGGPIARWRRYAKVLSQHAADADVVYAFSSVSCGMPLVFSGIPKKKRVLRLGGDFFWERYTDRGGKKSLREWYKHFSFSRLFSGWLLNTFGYIVFSTEFQQRLYKEAYRTLPKHSVIENASPEMWNPQEHHVRSPFRLLAMSRLVRFKNLESLVKAVSLLSSDVLLTIVGEGPCKKRLQKIVDAHDLDGRVAFASSVRGREKRQLFAVHDLLVVPSLTDISPNAALEAASAGLPVLLTKETGLSERLTKNMVLADLYSAKEIAKEVQKLTKKYPDTVASHSSRPWIQVAEEHVSLFSSLS